MVGWTLAEKSRKTRFFKNFVTMIFWRNLVCMVLGWQVGKIGQKSIFLENNFSIIFVIYKLNMHAKGRIEYAALIFYSREMKIDLPGTNYCLNQAEGLIKRGNQKQRNLMMMLCAFKIGCCGIPFLIFYTRL